MATRTKAGDAFSEVVVQVLYLNGLLTAVGDELASASGQSTARWRVLAAFEAQPRTVASAAAALGLTRQSVQRVANELGADGLTRTQANPADRRADLIELTSDGKKTLAAIQKTQARWADRLGAELGPRHLSAIRQSLQHLTQALTTQE